MLTSFVSRTREIARHSYSESKLEGELNQVLKEMLVSQRISYDPSINEPLKTQGFSHVSSRRPDSLFGHVVLDYKKPGTFDKMSGVKKAQKQVQDEYLDAVTGGHKKSPKECEAWAGIVWDGNYISFCHSNGEDWHWTKRLETSEASLLSLIQTYRALERKPLTSTLLCKDFGKNSDAAIFTIRTLCTLLENPKHRTNMLFREWKRLFEQVSTYNLSQIPSLHKWARSNGITTKDASQILFAMHTYYSIVVKLLTSELLAATKIPIQPSLVEDITNASNMQEVNKCFLNLENSEFYRGYRISNLLEGDFFSWYANEESPELSGRLVEIANKMQIFEPATAKLKPSAVKDLLKEFYSSIVDESIRHDIGEYYTPDWLVEYVLDQIGFRGNPGEIAVDPACGSGSFLVECIARVREQCEQKEYSNLETLKIILHSVRGLDLNPLAVISARANYILTIADLVFDLGEDIEIPVYLADAINVPIENMDGILEYPLNTEVGIINLQIPISLVKNHVLGKILLLCEDDIKANVPAIPSPKMN